MKYILIAVAALTISCDYNLVTDRELNTLKYRIEDLQQEADVNISALKALRDSAMVLYVKEKKMRQRLQDSLIWVKIRSIKCWENGVHRHSCQYFENYVTSP